MKTKNIEEEIEFLRQQNADLQQQLAKTTCEYNKRIALLEEELRESQKLLQSYYETEPALKNSEAELLALFNAIQDIIIIIDAEGRYLKVAPSSAPSLYKPPAEIIGKTAHDIFPTDLADSFLECIQQALKTRQMVKIEYSLPMANQEVWFEASVAPMNENSVVCIARDINDRKATEAALREQETQYRQIFQAVSDGISLLDLETGKNISVNAAFAQMHGYSQEEFIELDPKDFIHPDSFTILEEFINTIKSGGEFRTQAVDIRKDGTPFDIEITGKPLDYNGKPHAVAVVRDISERLQIEAQLRQQAQDLAQTLEELQHTQSQMIQAEKMSSLGELVAGVAHEINNPVNFIHGNLSHLEEHIQDLFSILDSYQSSKLSNTLPCLDEDIDLEYIQEDIPKILSSMKVGTQRIRKIVLSLRTFSRMDEAEFKAVDIHEGIDSTLMILQHRLKEKSEFPEIRVIKNYGSLPLVECYGGQLNQVFMNILANAIDALEAVRKKHQQPTITICTSLIDSGWVKIAIADNGVGMSEQVQQKVFNPFFTTKPVGKGTGMGMSISYQIITEKHGGKFKCFSTVGEGTEFVIEIPIQH